jgi:hypothetical protein
LPVQQHSFANKHSSSADYPRSFAAEQKSLSVQPNSLLFHQKTSSCRKRIAPESRLTKQMPCQEELDGPQRQKNTCAFNRRKVDIRHGQQRSTDKHWLPRREEVPLFAAAGCALDCFKREK